MKKNKVDIITLGCSKNLVDSEHLMKQFTANGYAVDHDPENADGEIVIINTCGFIDSAKEESIDTILEFAQAKKEKKINKLFVMGCLSERYKADLQTEMPEVDKFYGKFNWKNILNDLGKSYKKEFASERILTTPSHYSYIKIAEGCNRTCSYCSIPLITGKYKSREMEDIVEEVQQMVKTGVKEFQLIAQDLTYYGTDKYGDSKLADLIEKISDIKGVEWIRLHYAYPTHFPLNILPVIRERENVCKYLDIALQHSSDHMLKLMRRNITRKETLDLICRIRESVPGIHLRTTVMVGHPGETEEDFEDLISFVKETKFERLGGFPYSNEEGTYAARHYSDDIPASVKQERMEKVMSVQEKISWKKNMEKVGKKYKVIIDSEDTEYYVARTEFDSPEVDPEVLIDKSVPLKTGNFYNITIIGAEAFELYGKL